MRYEIQGYGSLHAHYDLWQHPDDVEQVQKEIRVHVPASTNDEGYIVEPEREEDCRLFRYVMRKQRHVC